MKRLLGLIWLAGSAVIMAFLVALLLGSTDTVTVVAPAAQDPRVPPGNYHPVPEPPASASPCATAGCHDGEAPHRSGKGAAFLNGHAEALDCTACHLLPPPGGGETGGGEGRRGYGVLPVAVAAHRFPGGWEFTPRRGEPCAGCHAAGSHFPWERLGYGSGRREELTGLAQAAIIDQKTPWIIPVF